MSSSLYGWPPSSTNIQSVWTGDSSSTSKRRACHVFCQDCISATWLRNGGAFNCPRCRQVMYERETTRRNNLARSVGLQVNLMDRIWHGRLSTNDRHVYALEGDFSVERTGTSGKQLSKLEPKTSRDRCRGICGV